MSLTVASFKSSMLQHLMSLLSPTNKVVSINNCVLNNGAKVLNHLSLGAFDDVVTGSYVTGTGIPAHTLSAKTDLNKVLLTVNNANAVNIKGFALADTVVSGQVSLTVTALSAAIAAGSVFVIYSNAAAAGVVVGVVSADAALAATTIYCTPVHKVGTITTGDLGLVFETASPIVFHPYLSVGNATLKNFTGTLSVPTGEVIVPKTVVVHSVSDTEFIKDDGNGNMISSDATATVIGTVDYETGAIDVTFKTAPTNLSEIYVDYYTSLYPVKYIENQEDFTNVEVVDSDGLTWLVKLAVTPLAKLNK